MAVEGRQRNRLADAATGGRNGERGAGDDGRRAVAVGLAVVLAGPDRVEAQPVDFGRELQALAIGRSQVSPSRRWTWKLKEMPNLRAIRG